MLKLASSMPGAGRHKYACALSPFSDGSRPDRNGLFTKGLATVRLRTCCLLSGSAMFSKKAHGDVKKSSQKLLDPKKDVVTRLKHLRVVLDNLEQLEARSFFEQYYSHIFYVFYENFVSVEASLKQRVHKAQREELDGIVAIFEKILLYVPDLIHARWQYQSIGRILKTLLHVGNCLKIRMDGLRLFLLWFMALQENSTEEAYLIYATLIHGFPTPPTIYGTPLESIMTHIIRPVVNSDYQVQDVEILPIIPCQPGDKVPDNLTRLMLEAVLHFSVSQLLKMHWKNQRRHEESFIFLLDNFRQYYLPHIFPGFSFDTSLYEPNLEIPGTRFTSSSLLSSTFGSYDPMLLCRVSVVQWVVSFITVKKAENSTISALQEERQESQKDSLERKLDASLIKDGETVSPSATLNSKDQNALMGASGSAAGLVPAAPLSPEEEELLEISRQIVQKVFYSSRGNINFVHEVLRQGFLLPMSEAGAVRKALRIYNDWIQAQLTATRPIFMEEPAPKVTVAMAPATSPGASEGVNEVDSPSYEQIRTFDDATPQPDKAQPVLPSPTSLRSPGSSSYLGAINEAIKEGLKNCNVEAGLQATIQVFITNSANVFLLEPVPNSPPQAIKDQVEICKRVLKLYRHVVMNVTMETRTWEQLLMVLLRVTEGVLGGAPSRSRLNLGQQLAQILFQTLIVSWIKANLKIRVSKDLWDRFLNVLSSLTHWAELITEWSKTMETLTRVLAKRVYGMDLNNLPLDKLQDNRNRRLRGPRGTAATAAPQADRDRDGSKKHDRTFSRGWSRCDSSSPKGSDEADGAGGKHRDRISTVGSRDDLDRLRQKMGYMRDVSSKAEATTVLASLNKLPLSTSTSQPSLYHQQPLQIISAKDDALGSLTRSSSEGKLTEGTHRFQVPVARQASAPEPQPASEPGTRESLNEKAMSLPEEYDVMEVKSLTDENDVLEFKTLPEDKLSLDDKISLEEKSIKQEGAEFKTPSEDNSQEDKMSLEEKASKNDEYRYEETKMGEYQLSYTQTDTVSIDSSEIATPDTAQTILDNNRLTPTSLTDMIASDIITPSPANQSLSSTPSPGTAINGEIVAGKGSHIYEPIRLEEQDKLDEATFETAESVQSPDASIMSGGTRPGWQPDVAFVLWRRILGCLGDVNDIQIARLHAMVMECLWTTWQLLAKIRDNLGVSSDNQNTPPPPEYIPPLRILSSWLFKAVHLSDRYQQGRLSAYKLLCAMTTRKQDHPLPRDHLTHFYRVLHYGLVGMDQEVINTIIQYSAPDFFSCGLPGSTLLILDYIQAANMIASHHNLDAPRIEALSLLGSLVCFPNLFCNITVLQPSPKDISTMQCKDVKDHLIKVLIKCSRKEPMCEARCIALCSLGIFLYEEMAHVTFHPRSREAISVLLASLKFQSRMVAQVACDMLLLLADHAEMMRRHNNEAPKKIIEVIAMTITSLLSNAEFAENEDNKKLVVSMLFCLLEWCMAVPLTALLEVSEGRSKKDAKILLETVFKVLQNAAEGVSTNQRTSVNFSELASADYDPHVSLETVRDGHSFGGKSPSQLEPLDQVFEDAEMQSVQFSVPSSKVVRLAAKTVMCHLINHLSHFPLGGGPALITSLANELDDLSFNGDPDETSSALFNSPNVQFFIFNNSSLISFAQLSDEELAPDLSGSLTTANSHARIVVRNVGGKFVWDTSILYGPGESRVQRVPEPQRRPSQSNSVFQYTTSTKSKSPVYRILNKSVSRLPSWIDVDDSLDVLDELQQFIGFTSPECLLNPGVPLNLVSPAPEEIPQELESSAIASLKKQNSSEEAYVSKHGEDYSMVTEPLIQTPHQEPTSPFNMCRQLLDQLGVMTWDRRSQINVVKKNDRLLRELKNLDSRQCRETHKIAVLYVAEGQEDKMSVLGNDRGSQAFENFIAGLAWEVDLSTHQGFLGGLQRNKSTGETAPYYATSTVEVIFHVSTRMPSENNLLHKMRHLGNDEVHIVWSEHTRDYRRGIIATEFGDVIIVIYPLENQLFRIQIQRKPEVPFFGPLFDGAIVDHKVLPGLVRATAINASRVKRSQLPLYQRYYEERAKYLETIIKNHKELSTFETFSAHVFDPLLARQLNGGGAANKAGSDNAPPTLTSAILDAQIQAHHSRAGTVKHSQDRAPQAGNVSVTSGQMSSGVPLSISGFSAPSGGSQGVQAPGPAGSGGTVQRPTRLVHPEKLVNLASSTGQMQKPFSGSMDEKAPLDPTSAGSTPVDPTAATVPQPKTRKKRASSSGSMTSESTPPESPADSKKK
ncbi:ral GTPase-activating protein subunit alpha-1-like isoform X2 [Acanthaster planci]|uniref:Ral GTPase-activating protein subunit alpha-1-like isoform X2 n=1 Tax=Acanthaster planci TaxID=133434 RepID=A0A8B7XSN7_ACAPL|nr:ral GTPase-activating protein subunit alpha-1-like isoform X2 [Acanthaster planci]